METRKRLDLALSLLAVIVMGILFFSGNAFAELPAPMLGSPVNGKEFIRGKEDFYLEVVKTDGSKYVEIWVDNNSGFGSPEIGYDNKQSPNYTGSDGIYLTGNNFVFSKALQNKVPENVYFWKARLLDANKKPSVWSLVKNFTLKDMLVACKINSISPTSKSFTYGAGSGSVSVNVEPDNDCSRTAAANNSWISITSGASGTGDGTVNYSISENASTSSRTGTITITGATNNKTLTITQDGKSDPLPPSYTWKTSSWSACDAVCGSGNKTRNVWCQRNDGQTVSDSYCSASDAKPNASDSCFQSCNPTAKITLLSPNPAKKGEYVFFSGEGSDPDGGNVIYKWMSSLSGELSSEAYFSNYSLKVGEHIITLQVIDDESSIASAQKTLTITEAINLIPTARITSHDNGHKVTSSNVKISGIASDDDGSVTKAQVKVNDGDWTDAQGTTSWSKDISLEEGANTVSCRAFDDKNAESPTYSITLNCEISQEAIELKDEEIASASIGKGGEQLYFIDVPDTATVIVIKTEGGKGNVVNLYVSRDSTPSEQSYRAKSYRTSGDERIRIDSGPADGFDSKGEKIEFKDFQVLKGRYYILVAAEGNGGDYNLRARYLELRFPFAGKWEITRGYNTGSTHLGTWKYSLDFAQQGTCDDYGQPIVASESGTVLPIYSVPRNITTGYGRKVEIDFGDGYSSLQGHMASRCVRTGIKVQRGQEIGMLGDTGNCEGGGCIHNGAHQHFSFLKDSMSIAPEAMSSVAEQRKKGFLAGQSLTGDDVGNPSTFVIIDDQDAENDGVTDLVFECGYRNRMSWANGSGENKDSTAAMIWRSEIPESGKYSVYAHIPDNYATAQVNYFIIHKVSSASNQTAEETINVNQEKYEDIWVRLSPEEGWYFEKGTGGYVKLTNANVPTDKKVAFDAIMFTQPDWGSAGGEELPSPEICDGLDNDCNGEIDEGFDVGSSCAVGTGACERIGNKVCSDDGTTTVCDIATGDPSEEICDNIDNDCDGEIDEGFDVGALCATGTGACERIGHKVCSSDGLTAKCNVAAGMPNTEICGDGLDNDCDGQADEGFDVGASCTVGTGACERIGHKVCSSDGLSTKCNVAAGMPNTEICGDGLDNDCDGQADEGFDVGSSCAVGTGACERIGNKVCSGDGTTAVCDIATGDPSEEICDNIDNDCDGEIDEGFDVGALCATGTGACERIGHKVCSSDGLSAKCNVAAGMPNTEICGDGLDNDCDGQADEGFDVGSSCTVGIGGCQRTGKKICSGDGTTAVCDIATGDPSEEICDNIDNDCDGEIDEGFDVGASCAVGTGACERIGHKVCSSDGLSAKCNVAAGMPNTEICGDGLDNDCDGEIDEGFDVGASCTVGIGACQRTGKKICSGDGTTTVCGVVAGNPTAEICCDGIDNDCDGQVDEVKDKVAPKAIAKNITIQLGAKGKAAITPADVDNGSSDNCRIAKMAVSPFSFTKVGSYKVTLSVVDTSGNKGKCTATVKVEDKIAPKAIAKDIVVQLNSKGKAAITAANVNNGSSDNGKIASMGVSPDTFTCANIGPNKVVLTVTDTGGNKSVCAATVTVEDKRAPQAITKSIIVQLDSEGKAAITVADVNNGSWDNCGIASMAVSPSSFANVGFTKVILTVTDTNGNKGACKATVKVEDKIAPKAIAKDITVQLNSKGKVAITVADVNNGSSDNCKIAKMAVSPSAFTGANIGPNKVVLTVIDTGGNKSACTATVTVEDKIAPVAKCKNITVQLDASGKAAITAASVNKGSSDNCGIANMNVSPSTFTSIGSYKVVLTVADKSGNKSTCAVTVTVKAYKK